jgi:hypothetical protein
MNGLLGCLLSVVISTVPLIHTAAMSTTPIPSIQGPSFSRLVLTDSHSQTCPSLLETKLMEWRNQTSRARSSRTRPPVQKFNGRLARQPDSDWPFVPWLSSVQAMASSCTSTTDSTVPYYHTTILPPYMNGIHNGRRNSYGD